MRRLIAAGMLLLAVGGFARADVLDEGYQACEAQRDIATVGGRMVRAGYNASVAADCAIIAAEMAARTAAQVQAPPARATLDAADLIKINRARGR